MSLVCSSHLLVHSDRLSSYIVTAGAKVEVEKWLNEVISTLLQRTKLEGYNIFLRLNLRETEVLKVKPWA